jgi:hypothetical protein
MLAFAWVRGVMASSMCLDGMGAMSVVVEVAVMRSSVVCLRVAIGVLYGK